MSIRFSWLALLSTLSPRSHSIPDRAPNFFTIKLNHGCVAMVNWQKAISYPKECHSIVTFIDWLVCNMPLNLFTLHFGRPPFSSTSQVNIRDADWSKMHITTSHDIDIFFR